MVFALGTSASRRESGLEP